MNELLVYDGTVPAADAGFRRILATEPDHPYVGAWWPPGHGLGYEHTFVNEIADFVRDVASGRPPSPSFADGLYIQRVLDAVERSSARNRGGRRSRPDDRAATPTTSTSRARSRQGGTMPRPVTFFTGQFADLPFDRDLPDGRRVGLRRPRDRLLGRPLRRRRGRQRGRVRRGPPRDPRAARARRSTRSRAT